MLWLWIILGALVAAAVTALVMGRRLPVAHQARRTVTVAAPPEAVFDLVSDYLHAVEWRGDLKAVERLPASEGAEPRPRYREVGRRGVVPFEVVEARRPSRWVTRVADPELPFGGRWTWAFAPAAGGAHTEVTLTEDGEIRNALFRFMTRYLLGYTKTIDEVLGALAARFEGADPVEG